MSGLIDPTTQILAGALGGLSQSETAIAANIANADTPGYQPVTVNFEQALQAEAASAGLETGGATPTLALLRIDPRHLTGAAVPVGGDTTETVTQSLRNDGNAVDVDAEMTSLADTQLRYSAVSHMLTGSLDMLREAMTPGA